MMTVMKMRRESFSSQQSRSVCHCPARKKSPQHLPEPPQTQPSIKKEAWTSPDELQKQGELKETQFPFSLTVNVTERLRTLKLSGREKLEVWLQLWNIPSSQWRGEVETKGQVCFCRLEELLREFRFCNISLHWCLQWKIDSCKAVTSTTCGSQPKSGSKSFN